MKRLVCTVLAMVMMAMGMMAFAENDGPRGGMGGGPNGEHGGGRMGGDFIGSHLVELSTGYDYVRAVIDVAMGVQPEIPSIEKREYAGVNFIMTADDVVVYEQFKHEHPGTILKEHIDSDFSDIVTDSSNRHGYYIFKF